MSENLPEKRDSRMSSDELVQAAKAASSAGYSKSAGSAYVQLATAQSLGLSPMAGLFNIYDVQGRPMLSGRLIAGMIKQSADYDYRVTDLSDESCTVIIVKRDKFSGDIVECSPVTYTMADARAAGNAGKDVWKKYPQRMLFYKAVANAATFHCPEVTMDIPAYEEGDAPPMPRAKVSVGEVEVPDADDIAVTVEPERMDEPVFVGEVVEDAEVHSEPDTADDAGDADDAADMMKPITSKQRARLWAIAKKSLGEDAETLLRRIVVWMTKQDSTTDIPVAAYDSIVAVIETWPEMESALIAAEGGE
jgi:hypothetical protein